jgi:hypothetical protein
MIFPSSQQNSTAPQVVRQINITMNWFEELKARVPVH